MRTLEQIAGESCVHMYNKLRNNDWAKLPSHICFMLGDNQWGKPLWKVRSMPPEGKVIELDSFADYMTEQFRVGLNFKSWWLIHSALNSQGKEGHEALVMIRAELPDYDALVERDRLQNQAEQVDALPQHGEIGRGRNSNAISEQQGNSAAYLIARLKRDRPDIIARFVNGEFKSARAAGIAAGIVKPPPTWPERLRTAWARCTAAERRRFLAEIDR